jgi:hypothetical protein
MGADRWRYNVVDVKAKSMWRSGVAASDLQAELDRHGAQGWELVTMHAMPYPAGVRLVFKRPA